MNTDKEPTIPEMLFSARDKGILHPRIQIGSLRFTIAPAFGINAGMIYIKDDGNYIGKVDPVKRLYLESGHAISNQPLIDKVIACLKNPMHNIKVHGQQTGTCSFCSHQLTNKVSIFAAIGPICAEKYGIDQYALAEANGLEAPAPAITLNDC